MGSKDAKGVVPENAQTPMKSACGKFDNTAKYKTMQPHCRRKRYGGGVPANAHTHLLSACGKCENTAKNETMQPHCKRKRCRVGVPANARTHLLSTCGNTRTKSKTRRCSHIVGGNDAEGVCLQMHKRIC
jgi:hypothetical protein